MLTQKYYINLVNILFYDKIISLIKKVRPVCFLNLSYHLEVRKLLHYHIYIYFFLSLYFGQLVSTINLRLNFNRLSLEKGYPMGGRLHISKIHFYNFVYCFSKWYYFNIFGELKSFILDKKKGNFFGLKIPFLNLFYIFDYNLMTLFLYNLNIPNLKIFISCLNSNVSEANLLKIQYGLI